MKITELIDSLNKNERDKCPYPSAIYEVDLSKLEENIRKIKTFVSQNSKGSLKFLLPIKANAYGNGMIGVSKFLEAKKLCDYFGVANFEEAYELREANIKTPILILNQPFIKAYDVAYVVKNNVEQAISEEKLLLMLNNEGIRQKKKVKIHLDIDTGMGRMGMRAQEIPEFIQKIKTCKNIKLIGVMTHFSVADGADLDQIKYTKEQIRIFSNLKKLITDETKDKKLIFHAANSGGILNHSNDLFEMIRPGISTYGYSENIDNNLNLEPIMQIKTNIILLKKYPKGASIGYGRTYITEQEELIGVIPIGYADGLNRKLSNRLTPIVNGKKVKSVGRISMDSFCVKVDSKTKVGDEVIIIGKSNTAEDIAKQIDTISYEIICSFGSAKRLRHEYVYKK